MTVDEIQNLLKCENFPSFASFAKNKLPMPGKKMHLADVLNQEILITDFRITQSVKRDNSDCLQIQFVDNNGEICTLFTGSAVLVDQIKDAREKLPFKSKIVKIEKYYSFS